MIKLPLASNTTPSANLIVDKSSPSSSDGTPALPTFPARPTDGGPLDLAPPKTGLWLYEPKINGWRVLVHAPTGTCWNRHGQRLSIEEEFKEALGEIRHQAGRMGIDWVDCEGLSRRHNIGKGSLIVLDVLIDAPCQVRGYTIRGMWCPLLGGVQGKVHSITQYTDGLAMWAYLRDENKYTFGCEFYEGLVAKRSDSAYPIQLRSPDERTTVWIKHRFAEHWR